QSSPPILGPALIAPQILRGAEHLIPNGGQIHYAKGCAHECDNRCRFATWHLDTLDDESAREGYPIVCGSASAEAPRLDRIIAVSIASPFQSQPSPYAEQHRRLGAPVKSPFSAGCCPSGSSERRRTPATLFSSEASARWALDDSFFRWNTRRKAQRKRTHSSNTGHREGDSGVGESIDERQSVR